MCQLFGMSAAQPVEVNAWLRTLAKHSVEHPHGWGVAVFHGEAVNLE
ncbi:MAG: class II glutamine amidotransferase [Oscillospiraceae bacterium]|nr:class II glutamine amidotransferase [Oscillospiraceae bacterium]